MKLRPGFVLRMIGRSGVWQMSVCWRYNHHNKHVSRSALCMQYVGLAEDLTWQLGRICRRMLTGTGTGMFSWIVRNSSHTEEHYRCDVVDWSIVGHVMCVCMWFIFSRRKSIQIISFLSASAMVEPSCRTAFENKSRDDSVFLSIQQYFQVLHCTTTFFLYYSTYENIQTFNPPIIVVADDPALGKNGCLSRGHRLLTNKRDPFGLGSCLWCALKIPLHQIWHGCLIVFRRSSCPFHRRQHTFKSDLCHKMVEFVAFAVVA